MKRLFLIAAVVLSCLLPGTALARQMDDMQIAVLRTIDKVSARTNTFEVPVDKTVKFGKSLFIRVRACRKASPLEQPEEAAFLQIWERKPAEEKSAWVFSGWMFASSPAVSAMDHPVYDVWVIACKNEATSEKSESFSTEAAPEGTPEKGLAEPGKDTPAPGEEEAVEEESETEEPAPPAEPNGD